MYRIASVFFLFGIYPFQVQRLLVSVMQRSVSRSDFWFRFS